MFRLSMLLAAASVACVPGLSLAQEATAPPSTVPAENAQTSATATVQLSEKQAANFGLALEVIAAQAKVAIVTEGVPLKRTLSPEEAKPLTESTPAEELVDKLAAAYDYRVVRVKASRRPDAPDVRPQPHVFALVKKYTNPDDLPDVTLEECQAAMRDVNQMLLSVSPNPPIRVNTPFILAIADSLTPEQEARLKEGIPVSELPGNVRGKIQQFGLHMYTGLRQSDAFGALAGLTGMDDATLCYMEDKGKKQLGFDNYLARNQDGATARYPRLLRHLVSDAGEYISTSKDPVEPSPQQPAVKEPSMQLPRVPVLGAMSLQDALTKMAPDLAASYKVDPILAEKKVVIAGASLTPPKEVAESLAQVYGLRVVRLSSDGGDRYRITRRIAPFPQRPAGVFELVRQTLPEPLLHATFDGEQEARVQASFKHYRTSDPTLPYAERMKKFEEGREKFDKEQQRIRGAASYMRAAAARRLQQDGEVLLTKHPKGVRFTDLPRSIKNDYGIITISNFIESLNTVPATPDYIKDWDNAVISGGPYIDTDAKKPAYALRFMGRNKQGDAHEESAYIVWDNRPNAQQSTP